MSPKEYITPSKEYITPHHKELDELFDELFDEVSEHVSPETPPCGPVCPGLHVSVYGTPSAESRLKR